MSKEGKVAVNGTGDHLGRFSWRGRVPPGWALRYRLIDHVTHSILTGDFDL